MEQSMIILGDLSYICLKKTKPYHNLQDFWKKKFYLAFGKTTEWLALEDHRPFFCLHTPSGLAPTSKNCVSLCQNFEGE